MNDVIKKLIQETLTKSTFKSATLDTQLGLMVIDIESQELADGFHQEHMVEAMKSEGAPTISSFLQTNYPKKIYLRLNGKMIAKSNGMTIHNRHITHGSLLGVDLTIRKESVKKHESNGLKNLYTALKKPDPIEYMESHGGLQSYYWSKFSSDKFCNLIRSNPQAAGIIFSKKDELGIKINFEGYKYHMSDITKLLPHIPDGCMVQLGLDNRFIGWDGSRVKDTVGMLWSYHHKIVLQMTLNMVEEILKKDLNNRLSIETNSSLQCPDTYNIICKLRPGGLLWVPPEPDSYIKVQLGYKNDWFDVSVPGGLLLSRSTISFCPQIIKIHNKNLKLPPWDGNHRLRYDF